MIERLQNSRGYLSIHMTYMRTCQKQESRARTSDYIIQHLRNIMARPCQNTCIWLLNPYTETYKRVVKLYTNILATYQNHAKWLHLYYPSVFHKDTENYTYEKNLYTPTISCDLKMSTFFILEMSKLKNEFNKFYPNLRQSFFLEIKQRHAQQLIIFCTCLTMACNRREVFNAVYSKSFAVNFVFYHKDQMFPKLATTNNPINP